MAKKKTTTSDYLPSCRFCGKQEFPTAPYESQEVADEAATMHCNCYEARVYQAEMEKRQKREKKIKDLNSALDDFANYCDARSISFEDELRSLVIINGTAVIDGVIGSVTVKWERVRATIKNTSKGDLSIEFAYSDSAKTEL